MTPKIKSPISAWYVLFSILFLSGRKINYFLKFGNEQPFMYKIFQEPEDPGPGQVVKKENDREHKVFKVMK